MEDYRVTQTGDEIQEILNQSPIDTADIVELKEAATSLDGRLESVEGKIPAGASEENPLTDKQYVDDSIASASATFRGTYNEVTDLELTTEATHADIGSALDEVIELADSNDYCFVQIPTADATPTEIESIERYKFVTGTGWQYEYTLNNSGFTADQWAAINSGITSGLVAKLTDLPTNAELNTLLNGKANAADVYTKSETYTKTEIGTQLGAKANSADVYPKTDTYTKQEVNALITTPEVQYVTVTATAGTTSVTDVLPATGAANTIYRVGSWDGTQYATGVYSEYAWNGTTYIPLDVKNYGLATGSDFDNPTSAQRSLVTTVGSVLDGISEGVFDLTAKTGDSYATLADALTAANTSIPTNKKKGGMSIKFVQSSDNNYVQYRYMLPYGGNTTAENNKFVTPTNWQGVDDEPTAGSKNLVKSGGVFSSEFNSAKETKENLETVLPNIIRTNNIFNPDSSNNISGKQINNSNGLLSDSTNGKVSYLIPIKAGVNYRVPYSYQIYGNTATKYIWSYNADGSPKQRYALTDIQEHSIIGSENAYYGTLLVSEPTYIRITYLSSSAMVLEDYSGAVAEVIPFGLSSAKLNPRIGIEALDSLAERMTSAEESITEDESDINSLEERVEAVESQNSHVIQNYALSNNLWNPAAAENKMSISNSDGTISPNNYNITSGLIQVKANKTYQFLTSISIYGVTNAKNIWTYNSDGTPKVRLTIPNSSIVDTVSGSYYKIKHTFSADALIRITERIGVGNWFLEVEQDAEWPTEIPAYGDVSGTLNSGITIPQLDPIQQQISLMTPRIYGKKIIWLGDSITAAETDESGLKGWCGRIARDYNGTYIDPARSGACITKGLVEDYKCILTQMDTIITNHETCDYLILSGGHNDADRIGSIADPNNLPANLGTYEEYTNFTGEYDDEKFCGALETLIFKAVKNYKGKKIGYILVHRDTRTAEFLQRRLQYHDLIKKILRKWGIPCLDLWVDSYLNPARDLGQYDDANGDLVPGRYFDDGQHLTAAGYDILTPIVAKFLESL